MTFLKTAIFVKNVPGWERAVRLLIAACVVAVGLIYLTPPWSWLVVASGIGFGFTGVFGFCPACALAGRRLAKGS